MLEKDVLAYLRRNPGSRCSDIATAHDTRPAFVTPVLQMLRAAGKVVSEGNTRGTRWSVAK
jgi:DNA-binding IscR family transcriptional regulator